MYSLKTSEQRMKQNKTELGEGDQKVQTFIYEINKSWDVIYSMVTISHGM